MPHDVGGKHKKPGDEIATSNFAAQGAEEIRVTGPAIGTEDSFSDKPDGDRQQYKPDKKQYRE